MASKFDSVGASHSHFSSPLDKFSPDELKKRWLESRICRNCGYVYNGCIIETTGQQCPIYVRLKRAGVDPIEELINSGICEGCNFKENNCIIGNGRVCKIYEWLKQRNIASKPNNGNRRKRLQPSLTSLIELCDECDESGAGVEKKCESKTSIKPSFSKKNGEKRDSQKCEIPVHRVHAKIHTSYSRGRREIVRNSGLQELPFEWYILLSKIESGKDKVTQFILKYIMNHRYGKHTHETLAEEYFRMYGQKIHRTTITKKMKWLREIGVITFIEKGVYEVNEKFRELYLNKLKSECENAAPRGAGAPDIWRVRIHGFQRAFQVVNADEDIVNLHELLSNITPRDLKKYGWEIVKFIKRSGSNDSYKLKHKKYPQVVLEVYRRKIIVEPAGKFSYEMSLEEFIEKYKPESPNTGAPDVQDSPNGHNSSIKIDPEKIEQDVAELCHKAVKQFVDDLGDFLGRTFNSDDLGWTGEKSKGEVSKKGINRPHIAFYDPGSPNTLYKLVEKYGKIHIKELGMYIDCSPAETTAEIEFENTENKTSAENAADFVTAMSRLLNNDVAKGLATLARLDSSTATNLANIYGGLPVNTSIESTLQKLVAKIEGLESELKRYEEKEQTLKKELSELKTSIAEVKTVLEYLCKVVKDVLSELVNRLGNKFVGDLHRTLSLVASLMDKTVTLEERVNNLHRRLGEG